MANGFWDRFGQAYTPAAMQSSAAALRDLATKKRDKVDEEKLRQALEDRVNTSLLGNKDSKIAQQGVTGLMGRDVMTEDQGRSIVQAKQVPEVADLLMSDQEITPDMQYDTSVIDKATQEAMSAVGERDRQAALLEEERLFKAAGNLPDHQKAAAYKTLGYDFTDILKSRFSPEENTAFEGHFKEMRDDKTVENSTRVMALYDNLVAALQEPKKQGETDKGYGLRQLAALNNFWKMSDSGAVRGEDVGLISMAQAMTDRIENLWAKASAGQIYGVELTNSMGEIADDILNAANKSAKNTLEAYVGSLRSSGVFSDNFIQALQSSSEGLIVEPAKRWGAEKKEKAGATAEPGFWKYLTPEGKERWANGEDW